MKENNNHVREEEEMSDVKEKRMIYSFSCPLPCNREIRVEAKNFLDAVDEMIKAGAMGCRSGKKQFFCGKAHLDMPPIPEPYLKSIVSMCTHEESNASDQRRIV